MNFHSILHRELMLTAKRSASYYLRAGVGALALVTAVVVTQATFFGAISSTASGQNLFSLLGLMGMLWALFEGFLLTIDAIARERRDGTLGLLFLSNLTGFDIVIGKAGSAGMRTLFGLLAAAPAPALTFLFGGVTLSHYAQLLVGLLNALVFALGLGLFLSTQEGNRRRIASLGALLLVWFALAAPVFGMILLKNYSAPIASLLIGASPVTPVLHVIGGSDSAMILGSLAMSGVLGCLLLIGAGWRLQKSWRSAPVRPQARALSAFWPVARLSLAVAFVAIILFPKAAAPILATALFLLHMVLSFNVTAMAARALAEERRGGFLEILLTTPVSEEEIIRRHLLSIKRFAVKAFLFLILCGVCLLGYVAFTMEAGDFFIWLSIYAGMIILSVLDLFWNARVGLWKGLQTGHPARALRRTFGILLATLLLAGLIGVLFAMSISANLPKEPVLIATVTAALIAFIAIWIGRLAGASIGLSERFRDVAAGES